MADVSQIKLPNGSVYDLIDEKSGYITADYIENKTDYEIPVSRVGEIVVGETAIGTDSTNFPTSKAVVDYVDERVVQEMDAIDVGVTEVKANGTSLSVVDGVVNIPAIGPNQSIGLMTDQWMQMIWNELNSIPTSTSQLTNDSGYLTTSDIASVMTYKGTKANYAALPSTGNTTGDVWHLTDTGAEWAWDGSTWQELGTAIDLSGYAAKATTLAGYGITDAKIQNGTITLGSNTITPLTSFTETDPTVPSWAKQSSKPTYGLTEISGTDDLRAIEALTGTSGLLKKTAANTWTLDTNTYLTSYTETDPVFSASAAAGITSEDIAYWNSISNTDYQLQTNTMPTSTKEYIVVGPASTTAGIKYYNTGLSVIEGSAHDITLTIGTASKLGKLQIINANNNKYALLSVASITSSRTITLPDKSGTVALTSDIPDTSSFLTSETDPVFSASAAAGITATDISNWNAKVSDDKTWNGVTLNQDTQQLTTYYVPTFSNFNSISAKMTYVTSTPSNNKIVKWDSNSYLYSTTPSANDNSTKVATTAYVDGAVGGITIPTKTSDLTNDSGFITSYTDEKVKIVQVNDSNSHYLIFGNYSTTATTQLYDADLEYITTLSNNQNGYGRINLGNSKAQGTNGAKYGAIRFYGTTTYGVEIQGGAPTAWRTITLPDKTGTIALTSDIPQVYSSTNTGGYLTMATLPIYDGTVV